MLKDGLYNSHKHLNFGHYILHWYLLRKALRLTWYDQIRTRYWKWLIRLHHLIYKKSSNAMISFNYTFHMYKGLVIQIGWKLCLSAIPLLATTSQLIFAHVTTAVVLFAKVCSNHFAGISVRIRWNFHPIWITMENLLVKWVIFLRTHWGNGMKFGMLRYPDKLLNRLAVGHGPLIFLNSAPFWLSEIGEIWGFQGFP